MSNPTQNNACHDVDLPVRGGGGCWFMTERTRDDHCHPITSKWPCLGLVSTLPLLLLVLLLVLSLLQGETIMKVYTRLPFRRLGEGEASTKPKQRILYIVTTLAEYNTGTRNTERGSDRLQQTLIPVVTEGITSMVQAGYEVDLYLVCHYIMLPEREALVRAALPRSVGLEVWSDATPLEYDSDQKQNQKLHDGTHHLARQHRFVIKDKLEYYDIFVNFEDDMLITARHVQHFQSVTDELDRLYQLAPETTPSDIQSSKDAVMSYQGPLTKGQLRRMLPGFIRVEVLLDEANFPAQSNTGPVPVDLEFNGRQLQVDPTICCQISTEKAVGRIPIAPNATKLMIWETHILPLGVRQMPAESWLGWVVLQRGPSQKNLNISDIIGDYWSNRNNDYYKGERRPIPMEFKYINNQGGWMATRKQLFRWHSENCPGGFLPPYEPPHYRFDGLDMRNVEWYSGGMQLSTVRHACNMQRIIMLDPQGFSKSLIYHTANNKQRQLSGKREKIFSKANTLLGQLNTIKKRAETEGKTQSAVLSQ